MRLTLQTKQSVVPGVISFWWKTDQPFTWKPGQFLHYKLLHENPDERGVNRFFTIASAPHEGRVLLTTRFAPEQGSSFKKTLQSLREDAEIEASGPSGSFTLDDPNREYVFIAGGIGITPFRSILTHYHHQNIPLKVTLLYSNRNQDIVFKEELEQISQQNPNLKIHYIVEPQRIDEEVIKTYVPDLQKPIFYVSGPEPMVEGVSQLLRKLGVQDDHLKLDYFPGYA